MMSDTNETPDIKPQAHKHNIIKPEESIQNRIDEFKERVSTDEQWKNIKKAVNRFFEHFSY